jgi:hypothetical protein
MPRRGGGRVGGGASGDAPSRPGARRLQE